MGLHRALELPVLLLSWKLAPALAAGNTVARPSEGHAGVHADAGRVP